MTNYVVNYTNLTVLNLERLQNKGKTSFVYFKDPHLYELVKQNRPWVKLSENTYVMLMKECVAP